MKTLFQKTQTIVLKTSACLLISGLVAGQCQAKAVKADFNGDGYEDLVVAVPNESIAGMYNAGAVKVVYGRADGTWRPHSDTAYLHQTKYTEPGVNLLGMMEPHDQFGASIAVGDFNNDGFDDLAVGSPGETFGRDEHQIGVVNVAYGSSTGLGRSRNHKLNMRFYKDGAYNHNYNRFGTAMVSGDFDGNGIDDLAVGFAGTPAYGKSHTGGVLIFFGKEVDGLRNADRSDDTYIMLDYRRYESVQYGTRLASGDLNGDGFDDLAIGAYEDTTSNIKSGSVYVAYGHNNWQQNHPRIDKIVPVSKNADSKFGFSMVMGNFDRDGKDELAIGMPGFNSAGKSKSGAVVVVNHQPDGRLIQRYLYQSLNQIPGSSQKAENFGDAVAAADFDNDGVDDLAIGIKYKTKNSYWSWKRIIGYGEVVVLYGDRYRYDFNFQRTQVWHQDTSGIEGGREHGDNFGDSLSVGDFNNDGKTDLLVGVPNESIDSTNYAGVVQFIWGSNSGLTANKPGKQLFHQGSFTDPGFGTHEIERLDEFGEVLVP